MPAQISAAQLLGCTALIAVAALPGLALAQEATTLQPITVEGTDDDGNGPVAGQANPMTQAGTKTGVPVTKVPQSVSVVSREELEQDNIVKLDAALEYVAGAEGAPFGFDSDTNWFRLRGFDATQTGVYQDGLQHFSYGFGGFYIDPALVERVDVLKGPASVLYGGANPGGIINYVSRLPTGDTGGKLSVGVDETGSGEVTYDQQGVTANGLAWRFTGKLARQDGRGAFDPGWRGVIAPSVSYTTDAGTKLTFALSYTKIDETHVGGAWLPYVGTVEAAPFGYIDREFNTGDPDYDWYKRDQILATGIVEHQLDSGWKLTNTTRVGWAEIDESAPYAYGYGDGAAWNPTFTNHFQNNPVGGTDTLSRIFFEHQTTTKTVLNDFRLEGTAFTGAARHNLLFGADVKWFEMTQVQSSVSSPTAPVISIGSPSYGGISVTPSPYIDNTITQKQLGIYAQDRIEWGQGWIATLNARYDWVDTEAVGTPAYDYTDGEFSWRIGLAREFENGVTPYVSAATFFNPLVGTSSLGALYPETGEQIEAGVKWQPSGSNLLLTAAAFQIERNGVVTGPFGAETQLGQVRSRGFELEAKGDIAPNLRLTAAFTAMDVEITEDADASLIGNTPGGTMERQAALKLTYDVPQVPGLSINGGIRYRGESWADDANTAKVPDVWLIDAGASFDFADGWNANLAVSNLADRTYVASCDGTLSCFYGEGRRVSLVVSKEW
ncbi:TonB-dependent siderophore receptor [Pseudooceanicola sp. LIPI14-2-Ac024]|uniref:TonB-dependent siderophore receptor n=1 Tax=Pseudooceanicola sp. LIPI14-2-Ac024 TaxID=3344875 RepID=UPI0035CF5F1B